VSVTDERRTTHGNYMHTAETARFIREELLTMLQVNPSQPEVPAEVVESLVMISVKLARIVNGDPLHADHWRDIAGYATLALEAVGRERPLA